MKQYIVLRNNREFGPFTDEEIRVYGLLPTDLVWVEGESTMWQHPATIEGLETLAAEGLKKPFPLPPYSNPNAGHFPTVSLEQYQSALAANEWDREDEPFSTSSKTHGHSMRRHNRSLNDVFVPGARLFGFGVLLIGSAFIGFVVIKLGEQINLREAPASQAVEIQAEVLPVSHSSHAAQARLVPVSANRTDSVATTDSTQAKNLLVQKSLDEAKRLQNAKKQKRDSNFRPAPISLPAVTESGESETKPAVDDVKPETPPPPARKPTLDLSANAYKVGLFGGISDLQLTISNPSSQKVEKAVVEVSFLKPNGSVVKIETLSVENLGAGNSRTLPVPSSSRGVKVRYQVISVE